MKQILDHLKANGESIDSDIAQAVGLSVTKVRVVLAEMTARGEIMSYISTTYDNGKKVEAVKCRLAGFTPKAAPGRKSTKVQLKLG